MTALGLSEGPEDRSDRPARPPVHYQISVTGRQAALFFLPCPAALPLAFFSGKKTGAAARKGRGAVATLANASDLPVPTLAPSDGPRETRNSGSSVERPAEEALRFAAEKRAALKEAAAAAATPVPVPTPVPTPPPPVPTAAPLAHQKDAPKRAPSL